LGSLEIHRGTRFFPRVALCAFTTVGLTEVLTEISILDLDSTSHEDQAVRKGKFEPELECKAVPTVPQLASSARRGRATPENAVFPIDSADSWRSSELVMQPPNFHHGLLGSGLRPN
jgi:hypothetical protein